MRQAAVGEPDNLLASPIVSWSSVQHWRRALSPSTEHPVHPWNGTVSRAAGVSLIVDWRQTEQIDATLASVHATNDLAFVLLEFPNRRGLDTSIANDRSVFVDSNCFNTKPAPSIQSLQSTPEEIGERLGTTEQL
uniref:Uncharacterized protein n=1 Tax=Knipowitschia caucasica TaxID=637954 RepID=A0AAV2L3R8_KNICA